MSLDTIFGNSGDIQPATTFFQVNRYQLDNSHPALIVNATQLDRLLDRIDCKTRKLFGVKHKVLRFLLRLDGELVFAAEGSAYGHIPPHWLMTGTANFDEAMCLSAGNVFFDDTNTLVAIDHQSGDFRPTFNSLRLVLPKLLENNIRLSDKIHICRLNDQGVILTNYALSWCEMRVQAPETDASEKPAATTNSLVISLSPAARVTTRFGSMFLPARIEAYPRAGNTAENDGSTKSSSCGCCTVM